METKVLNAKNRLKRWRLNQKRRKKQLEQAKKQGKRKNQTLYNTGIILSIPIVAAIKALSLITNPDKKEEKEFGNRINNQKIDDHSIKKEDYKPTTNDITNDYSKEPISKEKEFPTNMASKDDISKMIDDIPKVETPKLTDGEKTFSKQVNNSNEPVYNNYNNQATTTNNQNTANNQTIINNDNRVGDTIINNGDVNNYNHHNHTHQQPTPQPRPNPSPQPTPQPRPNPPQPTPPAPAPTPEERETEQPEINPNHLNEQREVLNDVRDNHIIIADYKNNLTNPENDRKKEIEKSLRKLINKSKREIRHPRNILMNNPIVKALTQTKVSNNLKAMKSVLNDGSPMENLNQFPVQPPNRMRQTTANMARSSLLDIASIRRQIIAQLGNTPEAMSLLDELDELETYANEQINEQTLNNGRSM